MSNWNPESFIRKLDSKVDPKPVAAMEQENTSTNNSTSAPPGGGRPGLASQGGVLSNAPASLGAGAWPQKSEQEVTSRSVKNVVSQSQTETTLAGLTPNHVTVTIGVLAATTRKFGGSETRRPPPSESAECGRPGAAKRNGNQDQGLRYPSHSAAQSQRTRQVKDPSAYVQGVIVQRLGLAADRSADIQRSSHAMAQPVLDHARHDRARPD